MNATADSPSALFRARFAAFKAGDTDFIWRTYSRGNAFYREYPNPADFRADYGAMLVKGMAVDEILEAREPARFAAARALLPDPDEPAEARGLLVYALVYQVGRYKEYHHELGLFLRQAGHWGFHSSVSTPTRRYRPGTPLKSVVFGGLRFGGAA